MIDVHCPEGGRHEFASHLMWCTKCDKAFEPDDVISLLNAAMQLTADEAMMLDCQPYGIGDAMDIEMAVKQRDKYARRWRGDTEESE